MFPPKLRFLLLPVISAAFAACFADGARADDAPRVVNVFYAPRLMDAAWKKGGDEGKQDPYPAGKKDADAQKKEAKDPFPVWQNKFADCIPGKFYDMRSFFADDAKFADGDLVVFNPVSKLCVVCVSSAESMGVVTQVLDTYNPGANVDMDCAVSIGADADGKTPAADLAGWRASGRSWTKVKSSADDDHGISYDFEAVPQVAADGKSLDFRYVLKVTYMGIDYATPAPAGDDAPANGITITPGKTSTVKLGETPEGAKGVYFHVTAKVKLEAPVSPVADEAVKKKMVDCIKKHLAEPAPPADDKKPK